MALIISDNFSVFNNLDRDLFPGHNLELVDNYLSSDIKILLANHDNTFKSSCSSFLMANLS